MALHQFFILSPRGDTIIHKDFRGDGYATQQEAFFRKVKFWDKGDCPPIFQLDDWTFIFIRRNNLLIVGTTKYNVSPSGTLELLNRLAKVFKDYCGVLTEESIRKNFILVYELLDEMVDFGYPQITSTEMLKSCVHNEATIIQPSGLTTTSLLMDIQGRTKASTAANIPISVGAGMRGKQKNEIYVDIIERLTVLFNASGAVVNSSIDGSILMKSFLSGNPELRLALNEDLAIGKGNGAFGSVVLDDCNFHECVHLDEFETGRTLHFIPPDGEFVILNYRVTADFRCPFRITPIIEETPGSPYKLDVVVVVRADMPEANHGTNVIVRVPLPRAALSCTFDFPNEIPGCNAEFNSTEKKAVWTIRKFPGGSEMVVRIKVTLDAPVSSVHKREIGPVSMGFEIPMYNVSNLQVRYLRISETHKSYNPYRWVRYIVQSSSYVSRVNA